MSLTSTMWTGLSGLASSSTSIGVTSDNIANMNTVGHRASRAHFEDLLSRSILGVGEVGSGVRVSRIEKLFHQGAIVGSTRPTDMAISGRGFFVVRGNHNGVDSNYFTRAGLFKLDDSGFLVNDDGMRVQGFMADPSGRIGNQLGDLRLNPGPLPPNPTANIELQVQLNGSSDVQPMAGFDPTDPAGSSHFSTPLTMYDSLGNPRQVNVYYTLTASGWEWNAVTDGENLAGGTPGTPTVIANGALTMTNGVITGTTSFNATVSFAGAAPNQALTFDFAGTTARAHPTTTADGGFVNLAVTQDGYASANFVDVGVGTGGELIARFDNGQTRTIARVALADFRSESGLARVGGTLFAHSPESGEPLIGFAGAGGRGGVKGSALEQSNVDLSTEFVRLITDQRAYQATSRTITTADELLAETVNLKR